MALQTFDPKSSPAEVAAATLKDGAAIVSGLVPANLADAVAGAREIRSDEARIGLINLYSLGWLRQETNQYLSVPLELARTYDERMRRLLGYTTHDRLGDRLGKYYGSDTSFIDKDNYARHYRPYLPEKKRRNRPWKQFRLAGPA